MKVEDRKIALRIVGAIRRSIRVLTAFMLGWMVLLSTVQLLLRWVFDTSLLWGDIQLQNLVLIVGLLGGVLAASENRHIRIDLLENFPTGKYGKIIRFTITILAGTGSAYLAWLGFHYVSFKKELGLELHSLLFGKTIPAWYIDLIIPICFVLMAFFFITASFDNRSINKSVAGRF